MTEYLDAAAIAEINEYQCQVTGENHAVLDSAGVENAAARPQSGTVDVEFFATIYQKAGALLHALASRQCFENGNKRTAWVAARTFLEINGVGLGDVEPIQADAFVRAVAVDHTFGESSAAEWFESVAVGGHSNGGMRLKGGRIRLIDLLERGQTTIRDLVADGVTFVGPAIVAAMEGTSLIGCNWDSAGGPEGLAWEIAPERTIVVGAVGLQNCSFVGCHFESVGYASTPEGITAFFKESTV